MTTIHLFENIGKGDSTALAVRDRLAANPRAVTVRINSAGGDVGDGLAIYNLLKSAKARVVVEVDGLACSAASLIAMAGDEIRMASNAMMMIHDPHATSGGSAAQHHAAAEVLDAVGERFAETYAARSGQTVAKIRDLMLKETWFSASEAVALGLATHVSPPKALAACATAPKMLAQFRRTPSQARAGLTTWRDRTWDELSYIARQALMMEDSALYQKMRNESDARPWAGGDARVPAPAGTPTWRGKGWDDLRVIDRHQLAKEDPRRFAAMRDAHDNRPFIPTS